MAQSEKPIQSPPPAEWSDSGAHVAAFNAWLDRWQATPSAAGRAELLPDGIALAKRRRVALRSLIAIDARSALGFSIPVAVRSDLPRELTDELEARVSGFGDLNVVIVDGTRSPEHRLEGTNAHRHEVSRAVVLDGRTYTAQVYGRRLAQTTKHGIPLHGIAIDGLLAVHESAFRELEPAEISEAEQQFASSKPPGSDGRPTWAEIGGLRHRFRSRETMQRAEAQIAVTEASVGPQPSRPALAVIDEDAITRPRAAADLAWTTGAKRVLVIRVDFSDRPGDPQGSAGQTYSAAFVERVMNTEVGPFYQRSSFGRVTMTGTATPLVYRMPKPASYYIQNGAHEELHSAAQSAAAASFTLASYDRIVVVCSRLDGILNGVGGVSGFADLGGRRCWINGEFTLGVVAHELGHTFGLFHANSWQVDDGDPASRTGAGVEYGDVFDMMSANPENDARVDFNPWFKDILGWLANGQVQTITSSGTYRVTRYDGVQGGTLALKIGGGARLPPLDYWISYRRNFADNASVPPGAHILWGYPTAWNSQLLDMNSPGSGIRDALMPLGGAFADPEVGVTVRCVAEGGASPNEYIDIQVDFGPSAPVIIAQPFGRMVTAGQSAIFTTSTNGVPLPSDYQWQRRVAGSSSWVPLVDGANFAGARSSALIVRGTTAAMNGDEFRCIVRGSAGAPVVTAAAALSVIDPMVFVTVAGLAGSRGVVNGTGSAARFELPANVAIDSAGNIYVTEPIAQVIRKIDPGGVVTTFAGAPGVSGSADGIGAAARFSSLGGLAVDATGNVFVADSSNHTIRKISPAGQVTTFAGASGAFGSADGLGASARFALPSRLAIDRGGNLYVTEGFNATVRKITPAGLVTTLAGAAGGSRMTLDGIGRAARFRFPGAIAVTDAGTVYVVDQNTLRAISPEGAVTTLAGLTDAQGGVDGQGAGARFSGIHSLAVHPSGYIYATDGRTMIRAISPTGMVATIAGADNREGSADGAGVAARFRGPAGLAIDRSGNLYLADAENYTLRKGVTRSAPMVAPQIASQPLGQAATLGATAFFSVVAAGNPAPRYQWQRQPKNSSAWSDLIDGGAFGGTGTATLSIAPMTVALSGERYRCQVADGAGNAIVSSEATLEADIPALVTTIAGSASARSGSMDGQGLAARFLEPAGIALDSSESLLVTERNNHTIRKISPSGNVITLAGKPGQTGRTNGSLEAALFYLPEGIAVRSDGSVFVSDSLNQQIRRISPGGSVTTFSGSTPTAQWRFPKGVAIDRSGNVYVADSGNQVVRKITPAGIVSVLAGSLGQRGTTNGPSASARFLAPEGVAVDAAGNVFVADSGANSIRKISSDGAVTSILEPTVGPPVIGAGSNVRSVLAQPRAVAVDGAGNIYVADSGRFVIRRITPSGIVTTVAGAPGRSGSVDGVGGAARFHFPQGIALNRGGELYVADTSNNLIRKLELLTAPRFAPQIMALAPAQHTAVIGTEVRLSVATAPPATSLLQPLYQWRKDGSDLAGATSRELTLTNAQKQDAGVYSVVVTNIAGAATADIARLEIANDSRLTNLSVRSQTGGSSGAIVVGFYVAGAGNKQVLFRGVGPSLEAFGVSGALADPKLTLYGSSGFSVSENDDWGGDAGLESVFARVGAFALPVESKDSALTFSVTPGPYTVQMTGRDGAEGVALLEAYDADAGQPPNRLSNLSVRTVSGSGDSVLTVGFFIAGVSPKNVLLRAVGPALAAFGVAGTLPDPRIRVFSATGQLVRENDDWGGTAELVSGFASVGAFALPIASKDAAMVIALPPGAYSAQAMGAAGTAGVVLVEIYDLD